MLAKSVRVVFLILFLVHLLLRNLPSLLYLHFLLKGSLGKWWKKKTNFFSLSSTTTGDVQHQLSVRAVGMHV